MNRSVLTVLCVCSYDLLLWYCEQMRWTVTLGLLVVVGLVVISLVRGDAAGDAERFHELLVWLKEGGAQSVPISIETFSAEYRGVHTLQPILNGSLIMTIPRTHIMTDANARQSPIGQAIADAGYVPRK